MNEVLDKIIRLLDEFSTHNEEDTAASPRMAVRDPLETAFFALQFSAREGGSIGTREREARRRHQEYQHYSRNISILLWFLFNYIEHYGERDERWRDDNYFRLMLDVEKLLSDTRSLMDSVFQVVVLCSSPSPIPRNRQKSFGRFAEWSESNQTISESLVPPLSFVRDLAQWGLTVRQLRDNYIHSGHEGLVFISEEQGLFFDINHYSAGTRSRNLPDALYVEGHPRDDLIYLEKFVAYVIAPVFALSFVLGDYLLDHFSEAIPGWHNPLGTGQSSRVGGGIKAAYELMRRNPEILNPTIYLRS